MSEDYYNTNAEQGDVLRDSQSQAARQQEMVLAFFQQHPRQSFAPHEVHDRLADIGPLTSVRRAMTNLTSRNLLIKTSERRTGTFGKMVYTWQLMPVRMTLAERVAAMRAATSR